MSALVLAQVTIKDREAYAAYEAGFLAILNDHQGQIVSVDESPDVLEGDWPCTRTVVLKFESKAMARRGTHQPSIRRWRKFGSTAHQPMSSSLMA